ncbi:GntR family transcriptional regulator [Sphingobium yanoikuyae]|jgi:DNA-binding FadR family transcriptional regulator|uniref:GntR family transcriptional regulator n=1 Tax=Sphingobium yanoikuyae TaxID=13690 RepID=A0AA42WUT7_SPHYA|nr:MULTISPECIES: GntR family transcriptional regulator [Sphingobium]MBV2150405.1 GntR family transcriptional regulator [Sphingobium sp. AS12]MDH2130657.1 GntR family transcriptional regulator [Sphingobium yanoikuyae]MDH2151004.1 GntR family transcriptional regulator [Sphingobium yanoikuyae]MDH2166146.1 GntR family transcriptional regulator [Sphingobium yanoikuyae]QWT14327.1 GntR family transcriptional regulator [Sphingobium xenophagum]|tara:strand:- start:17531 stop:18145 length:615 start_codon:yes stop_codon:yes gene_type:complete
MSPEPVLAERAYLLLKADIMAGRFASGSIINERALAAEYGVSVSPLRDAAQRLVGEHMLEIAFGGGYRLPAITTDALCDLYRWHGHLVRLILKANRLAIDFDAKSYAGTEVDGQVLARAATNLFLAIAQACGDHEHRRALKSATERLHIARLGEVRVLGNLTEELEAVRIATASGQGPDRFEVLWAYHRRRIRRVSRIWEAISS